jgi:hypothetical protein
MPILMYVHFAYCSRPTSAGLHDEATVLERVCVSDRVTHTLVPKQTILSDNSDAPNEFNLRAIETQK